MIHALTARGLIEDEPPDGSRHKLTRRRLGAVLAVASALAMGVALLSAPQSAQAVTSIDGQWTVVHGGTGQVSLNVDGTYTSTCEVNPAYLDAWCPAPSGTFQYSTMSTASVTFTGADGSTTSYRVSGLVSSPDTITSVFGSRTYSPLVMKKGNNFVCTDWEGTGTSFTRWGISPELEYDAASNLLYATGSHDLVGPKNIDTQVNLAETAPNYFQNGQCADFATPPAPNTVMGVTNIRDASTFITQYSIWGPKATVTIKDAAGTAVSGATVNGSFTDVGMWATCITGADGSCTIDPQVFVRSSDVSSSTFTTDSVTKDGMTWDGIHATATVYDPSQTTPAPTPTPTPTPTPIPSPVPATHHIGDLDNATATLSSSLTSSTSLKTARSATWQPKVAATVLDSTGAAVAGATVSGTFSNHKGTLTCVTAANGICTLGNFTLSTRTTSTVFTVTDVVKASSTYVPKANTDPDGDSTGTTITVKRP